MWFDGLCSSFDPKVSFTRLGRSKSSHVTFDVWPGPYYTLTMTIDRRVPHMAGDLPFTHYLFLFPFSVPPRDFSSLFFIA